MKRPAAGRALLAGALTIACAANVHAQRPAWESSFEAGFPSNEWLDMIDHAYSSDGRMPPGRESAWTIVDRRSGAPVFGGERAYKGWIERQARESHRAYPVVHVDLPTPLVNTFMVYLDVDQTALAPGDWIHFATWGNHDPADKSGTWALHTMAVRNGKLEFAHTSPFHGEYIGPYPQPAFPLRSWVRLTVYLHYRGDSGYVHAWQDGIPALRAQTSALKANPGYRLRTAHWGLYAAAAVRAATQYNDDIRLCTLDAPLVDFSREPGCGASSPAVR
jgi:hypothetical protein